MSDFRRRFVKLIGVMASLTLIAFIATLVILSSLYAAWLGARLLYGAF